MNIRHLYKLANKYDAEYVDSVIEVYDKDGNILFSGKLEQDMVSVVYDEEIDNNRVIIDIALPDRQEEEHEI